MESFSVSSTLTTADWRAYQQITSGRAQSSISKWWSALIAVALVILWYFVADVIEPLGFTLNGSSFVLGVVVVIIVLAAYRRILLKRAKPGETFLGDWRFEFGASEFHSTREGIESSVNWSRVKEITESSDHLYLWIDHNAAYVVPVRDLPLGVQRQDAVDRFRFWAAASASANDSQSGSPTITDHEFDIHSETASAVKGSLFTALLRLLTLRKANGATISGSDRSILVLILLPIALWTLIDRIRIGGGAKFYFYNIPNIALFALALIVFSLMLARRSRPASDFRRVFSVVLAFLPVVILATVAIEKYLSWRFALAAALALGIYALLYIVRAMTTLTGKRQLLAALTGFLFIAGVLILNHVMYLGTSVWYAPEARDGSKMSARITWDQEESLLFDQRDRIDKSIASIQPPTSTAPAFFFVGFAGVGEQRVFAEEIKLAAQVVGHRYGSSDRSLLLVNDRRDVNTRPLATVSGLRYALHRLASKMDTQHDILFLALSSHGSQQPSLSVSNHPLPLKDVTGEDLAAALRGSGIKWRVIVISACHAGAFIPYLRDPFTIVITAAASDRTSFGCSDDRDLTYFGEAFYRDALPQTRSLHAAFEMTKTSIAAREKQENVTASQPQAYFGAELQQKLQDLNFDAGE